MMKRSVLLWCGWMLLASSAWAAAPGGVGLGVILGDPTGFSAKFWLDQASAVDLAAAWSFSGRDSFQLHGDYLLHDARLFVGQPRLQGRLLAYYGLGARLQLEEDDGRRDHDDRLGLRLPLGLNWLFSRFPLDAFFEVVPTMDLIPDTDFDFNAALGLRFYLR